MDGTASLDRKHGRLTGAVAAGTGRRARASVDFGAFDFKGPGSVRARAERSLGFALASFGAVVETVTIRLGDANGPRGGVDKECTVTARLRRKGAVRVTHRHHDLRAALDGAAERLARRVSRHLDRLRESRRSTARRGDLSR
jgi:ribosome-associated translation inhibitor RaiA